MSFSLPSIKCSAAPRSSSDYLWACGNQIPVHYSDNKALFGRSRKLGGANEYLMDGSEKRVCRSTVEFQSSHVIEKRSKWLYERSYN